MHKYRIRMEGTDGRGQTEQEGRRSGQRRKTKRGFRRASGDAGRGELSLVVSEGNCLVLNETP